MNKAVEFSYSIDDFITFQGDRKFAFSQPEPNEFCWFCPRELGLGTIARMTIKPGFDLWVSDCTFHRDVVFHECDMPALMQFSVILSGHYQVCWNGIKDPLQYFGEYQAIGYHTDLCDVCRVVQNVPIRYVSLTLYPDVFAELFEEYLHQMPPLIHHMLSDTADSGFLYQSAITPNMREIVHQIIGCPYQGVTRKLFLESKALELLSLQLHQLGEGPPAGQTCCRMHPHDKKQVEGVKNHIQCNLDAPPNLNELAKAAGMSHPKLNRCFKQVYGMTVFQFLRTERLNKARTMLENRGYSVTETAFHVGYESVSHFSQIYKKQFGTSPSRILS